MRTLSASPHIPAVTSPWGALTGGVQRLAFHANQCGEAWPHLHSADLHTGPPHIPAVTSPRGALKGGVQRLAFHAKPIWGDPPESTLHTGPSAPLPPSRGPNAEGALVSHAGPAPQRHRGPSLCSRTYPSPSDAQAAQPVAIHPTPESG